MPIGMISKFARSFAEARWRRGYQSSGVAILRPSTNVTTSSVAVNSTARARRSPTSISKVVIPGRQKVVAICSYVADDISEFVRGKPHIHGHGQIVKPEF